MNEIQSTEPEKQKGISWKVVWSVIAAFVVGFVIATVVATPTDNWTEDNIDQMMESMVEELMTHPDYLDRMNDIDYDALVAAYMANPDYLAWLREPDSTPEEDCAAIILSAVAVAQIPMLPTEDVESLCDWYEAHIGSG